MKKKDKTKELNIDNGELPTLTDEQLEIFSAHVENSGEDRSKIEPFDQSTKAKIIRYAKKHKATTIVFLVSAISILAVVSLILVYFFAFGNGFTNKSKFTVQIGENKYKAAYNDVMINDTMYIDVTKISEIDDIQISGDATSRKFTLPNLQYIRFENDSYLVIVDGSYIEMDSKAIISKDSCLVPLDFLSKIFDSTLSFEVDEKKNTIEVKRIKIGEESNKTPVYQPLAISTEAKKDTSNVAYEEFGVDGLSNLTSIDPNKDEYLVLVNHESPLSDDYIPTDLVSLNCDTNPANPKSYYSLRVTTEKALSLMMTAMKNSGIDGIQVSSSYRSYARQEYLLNDYVNDKMSKENLSYEKAKEEVMKTLALPGHSEHQTGLSVDFVQGTSSLTEKFENTTAFEWLSENAHKFGFILRYPKDKTDITGYDYEPWHYRFVGRTVASRIYEAEICYEEYCELMAKS